MTSPSESAQTPSDRPSTGRGLARGLDSLIPAAPTEPISRQREASLDAIVPNRSQPRQRFDESGLAELASSIQSHGMLQPLLVRVLDSGGYELIAGERRWRAAKLAGLTTAPVVVQERPLDDPTETLMLALVENLQRSDLNPIEAATAFRQLQSSGWTQERIAAEVDKSRAAVANAMRLLRLPTTVQSLIANAKLSEGHGRALLAAASTEQLRLAERAVEHGWSVRELERIVRERNSHQTAQVDATAFPHVQAALRQIESALGTRVEVRVSRKGPASGGRIVIHWYDEEQLTALASRMSVDQAESSTAPNAYTDTDFGI